MSEMITQLQLEDLRNEARRLGIYHKMNVFDIAADSIEALQEEVERLRDENRSLAYRVNISPETAKLSSPAIAIAAQHEASNQVKSANSRAEQAEARLSQLLKRLEHLPRYAQNIQEKCEQYWNEDNVLAAEYHAALQVIHDNAQQISYAIAEAREDGDE